MITKIIFLLGALFLQELVLLNTVLLAAHHGVYSGLLIFILFIAATIIDIGIGFYVGRKLYNKTANTRIGKYIKRQSERFVISEHGPQRWIFLLVLGNINFCYINAAVAGYLDLPFWESQAYNFFGNILSYVLLWYLVGSVSGLFKNIYTASGAVLLLTLAILFTLRKVKIKKV